MGEPAAGHLPVMVEEVLALFEPALQPRGAILVDATLGRAGHARALLDAYPGLALIGVDTDTQAIEESRRLLAPYADRVTLVHGRYDQLPELLSSHGDQRVQGILFDLGVSSPQLDDPARGFAYSYDAPLDMRMDQNGPLTAADVLNTYPAGRLAQVLRDYGEERFARRIADAVVRARTRAPLRSTGQLAEIVRDSIPAPARRTGGNPAKRTFQALRIEVNGELDVLHAALPGRSGRAGRRRPHRGARLPLAGGPGGQDHAGPGRHRPHTAGPAGAAGLGPAHVPAAHPRRAAAQRGGTGQQSAGRPGPIARRRADPGSGMTAPRRREPAELDSGAGARNERRATREVGGPSGPEAHPAVAAPAPSRPRCARPSLVPGRPVHARPSRPAQPGTLTAAETDGPVPAGGSRVGHR